LSKVETSYPVLQSGIVQAQLVDFSLEMVKKKGTEETYPNASIKWSLAQPWKTVSIDNAPSKEVNPGFIITENIYLGDWTDEKTGEVKNMGIQRLALLREAMLGKAETGTKFNPEELKGNIALLKLEFNPSPRGKKGETFGPRTDVVTYVRKPKS
jgi:hypothetical protein